MAAMSNYLETQLSALLFEATAYTAPSTYIALYTSDPTDADTGTEVSGGSYAREQVNTDGATSPYWNTAIDGLTDNNGDITFTQASASWGTVSHMGIRDALSGGNLLIHGALTASKTVDINDTFKFASGDLDVTLA